MHLRARRGIEALAVLLAVFVSFTALAPLTAQAATSQITGLISTCGGPIPPVAGATVTLIDANGITRPATTTSAADGTYAFSQPPPAKYIISANESSYYAGATTIPVRFDGTQTKTIDLCLYPHGVPAKGLMVTVLNGAAPVQGATVTAYQSSNPTGRIQFVTRGNTSAAGTVNLTLWPAVFQLRTSAAGLSTVESSVDVSTTSSFTVNLAVTVALYGWVNESSGSFLNSGVVAWLYNPAASSTSLSRLIPATVRGSLYQFETGRVPPASYKLIVGSDGHLASVQNVTMPGVPVPHNVSLQLAPKERYETTILYGTQDWNNLTVYRNLTLNLDSTLPGLGPPNLRNLRLQIDATLGDGNGVLDPAEIPAFYNWLVAKGPAYVATDGFLSTNGRTYNSTVSSFQLSVSNSTLSIANARVWINSTVRYALKQTPPYIAFGAKVYFVNMTMVPDSNGSAYKDYVYIVSLPKYYELNTTTLVPANAPVATHNFTRITVDPGVTPGTPQIRMTISPSLTGTARAKVTAPVGKFYVQNATFTNYQAYVANNTTLTFSAGDSTDPNGHITDANFTWRFTPSPGDVRYGITPTFKYARATNYSVNLTVVQGGGNKTYRDITLYVDDQLPTARIRTNRTGAASANGRTLNVDEGTVVRFDGGLSTDLAYLGPPSKPGVILDSGYAWDFDGDRITDRVGRIQNYTLQKPGTFKVNLTVTDSVGWKGANATMTLVVNDTKAPTPAFDILDPTKDWGTTTTLIERRTYSFNASRTTDDHDKVPAMNFTWVIPGPLLGSSGTNHTLYGLNVTFAWAEWNNSYKVVLSVRDSGFRGGLSSPKPNTGNLTRNVTVQIDVAIHADLRIDAGTLKIVPGGPEEGVAVAVIVNVSNKPGRLTASNVTTQVLVISGGQMAVLTNVADWVDKTGHPMGTNHTIVSNDRVQLVFHVVLYGQGNKTLQAYVYDSTEPYTWITSENRASSPVNVRQPAWQPYAIWGSVIGVIALFVGGMYARRKIKAGEWRPIRGRRKERGEGEEKRPKKEAKEEKKRL